MQLVNNLPGGGGWRKKIGFDFFVGGGG